MVLLRRAGRSLAPLVRAQREMLSATLESLDRLPDDPDEVDLWRHHNAAAASVFLDALSSRSDGSVEGD